MIKKPEMITHLHLLHELSKMDDGEMIDPSCILH